MADGNVRLRASASFSQLENELAKTQTQLQKKEQRIQQMTNAYGRMEAKGTTAFGKLVRNASVVAGTYAGIHRAISAITEAIRAQIEQLDDARRATMNFASAKQELFLPPTSQLSDAQLNRLEKRGLDVLTRGGVREPAAIGILGEIFSATQPGPGGDQEPRVVQTLEAAQDLVELSQSAAPLIKDMVPPMISLSTQLGQSFGETMDLMQRFQSTAFAGAPSAVPKIVEGLAGGLAALQIEDPATAVQATLENMAIGAVISTRIAEAEFSKTANLMPNFIKSMRTALLKSGEEIPEGTTTFGLIELMKERGFTKSDFEFAGRSFEFRGAASPRELSRLLFDDTTKFRQEVANAEQAIAAGDPEALERFKRRQLGVGQQDPAVLMKNTAEATRAVAERTNRLASTNVAFAKNVLFGPEGRTGALLQEPGMPGIRARASRMFAGFDMMLAREEDALSGAEYILRRQLFRRTQDENDILSLLKVTGDRRVMDANVPVLRSMFADDKEAMELIDGIQKLLEFQRDQEAHRTQEIERQGQMLQKNAEEMKNVVQGAVNAAGPREGPE